MKASRRPRASRRRAGSAKSIASQIIPAPTFAALVGAGMIWLAIDFADPARRRDARGRLLAFIAGVLPAVLVTAALNVLSHGSLFASGYGSIRDLLSVSRLGTNLLQYAKWLLTTSPLTLGGGAALAW